MLEQLSIRVAKINAPGSALRASPDFVQKEEPDLVVLATEGRGLARWMQPSTAQRIARLSGTITLFVPAGCRPIVSMESRRVQLTRVLIPVVESPRSERACVVAARAAATLGEPPVRITRLHVGDDAPPELPLPRGEAWH